MYIEVEVKSLPPEAVAVVVVLCDDLHPSQSMSRMSFPEAGHMHDSLNLHSPQIDKMSNIGFLALSPSSACSYILHSGVHLLDISDTMIGFRNSVGPAPQLEGNFRNQGNCLWCVHLCDNECTKYIHDSLSLS